MCLKKTKTIYLYPPKHLIFTHVIAGKAISITLLLKSLYDARNIIIQKEQKKSKCTHIFCFSTEEKKFQFFLSFSEDHDSPFLQCNVDTHTKTLV